jgi:hypothetical protein
MRAASAVLAVAGSLVLAASASASLPTSQHRIFLPSAKENKTFSQVTLPLYQGTSKGRTVWYIVTDASTREAAVNYGANYAPKLAVAANTSGVQPVTIVNGLIDFPGTVDFSPDREVDPGPYTTNGSATELGLPASQLKAGAVGDADYSPLIQLPDGTVLNASHIANDTGQADKAHNLVKPDPPASGRGHVTIEETTGFFEHHTIHYFSVDASVEAAAVLENVTFAPKLAGAPGGDPAQENLGPSPSARAGIIAFTNGQTGLDNPQRQGLNSTILDGPQHQTPIAGPVPLNIIQAVPNRLNDTQYSPLWDAHLTRWDPDRVPLANRKRQIAFDDVQALAASGDVTNPTGGPWGRSGPVPNCPIVSTDGSSEMVIPKVLIELRSKTAKAGRRVKLAIQSTDPVTGVKATIRLGSKRVASGKLAALNGPGTLAAKGSRRLGPGRYRVTLTAKDLLGQTVQSTSRIRLRR